MSFEGSNISLCCISAMNMGWYQLVIHVPLLRHDLLVLRTRFIVKDLEIDMMIALLESLHDGIVCLHSMNIFS